MPVYEREKNARDEYGQNADASIVREFNEEAYWNDLNDWLDKHEPRILVRFPEPHIGGEPTKSLLSGVKAMDAEIDKRPGASRLAGGDARDQQALPQGKDDLKLRDIQQAYDDLRNKTGKAPSQRAVADRANYARNTVAKRWSRLKL